MEKNKELTPMIELIEMCKTIMENATNKAVYETANLIKFRAEKELLPKEKQVIEEAYKQAHEDGYHFIGSQSDYEVEGLEKYLSQIYYNTKYNNQIK